MKRSEINEIITEAILFFNKNGVMLPDFAFWSIPDWEKNCGKINELFDARLGWDVTDMGRGNFPQLGLVLFTLRNKTLALPKRSYAEKIMLCNQLQSIPLHLHKMKIEDIINRGGGTLFIEIHNSSRDLSLGEGSLRIHSDGRFLDLHSGDVMELKPGQSVTIPQYSYHRFWAEKKRILIGEVSSANDDETDNYFIEEFSRFPTVEEDEPPMYPLVSDYKWIIGNKLGNS